MRPLLAVALASAVASGMAARAPDLLSRQLAESFDRKLTDVLQYGAAPSPRPRATLFAERELNSYLRFKATDQLPVGLTEPAFTLMGRNRVSARAIVDLDLIRQKQGTGGWFDPVSYLTGRIPIEAEGLVYTGGGKGRVEVEHVEALGIPVPKLLLQQILTFYTASPEDPDGASLDDTYLLPAQIKRLDVQAGRVAVVQ
jgi:hypothetical protein